MLAWDSDTCAAKRKKRAKGQVRSCSSMAYSGYSNYGGYYGQAQDGYESTRSNVPTSSYPDPAAYEAEARQAQYPSQDYSWPIADSQSYPSNISSQGQYAENPSQDNTNGQTHDYQQAHTSHVGSNKRQAEVQSYQISSSQLPKQTSTQALDELAYASGLEASGMHKRKQTPHDVSVDQGRVKPVATDRQHNHATQAHSSPYYRRGNYQNNDQQRQLALSAVAALHNVSNSLREKPTSPVMDAVKGTLAISEQQSLSPYMASQNAVSHRQTTFTQSRNTQQVSSQVEVTSNTSATELTQAPKAYSGTSKDIQSTPRQRTNSNRNSISQDVRQETPPLSVRPERINTTKFVSPMDIFDPFGKEREKARREAAAAEAAAKKKAVEEALKARSTPTLVLEVDPQKSETDSVLAAEVMEPKARKAPQPKPSALAPSNETDQEAEMRQIMARMKELRNKDPAKFQKVWDEEKKTPARSTSRAPSAPPIANQHTLAASIQASTSSGNTQAVTAPRGPAPGAIRGFNGYRVVVDANEECLPDLGKFPAERRFRTSHNVPKCQGLPTSTPHSVLPTAPPKMNVMARSGPLVFNVNATPDNIRPTTDDSIPVSQPLPPRDRDGTTIWPEETRKALAESAIRHLRSGPHNDGLTIGESEIIGWLVGNPSYIDLCKLFEGRGFKFDRAGLARSILKDNPILSKQNSHPPKAPRLFGPSVGNFVSAAPPAVFRPPAANSGTRFVTGEPSPFVKPEAPSQHSSSATPFKSQQNTSLTSHTGSHLSLPTFNVQKPVPGSKEDNARKRNFDDLIDLTNDDDEEYIVPEKRRRVRSPSADPISLLAQSWPRSQNGNMRNEISAQPPILPGNTNPLRFDKNVPSPRTSGPKPSRGAKVILAKQIKKNEALRRNYYDPKTIAKDILISSGRHPDERPLNGHMAGLLGTHIELDSDLNTFNWEDIDPGGPPAPKTPWTNIPSGPPRFKSRKPLRSSQDFAEQKLKLTSEPPVMRPTQDFTDGLTAQSHITPGPHKYKGRFGSGNYVRVQEYERPAPRERLTIRPSPLVADAKPRDSSPEAANRAAEGLRSLAQLTRSLFNDSSKPPDHRSLGPQETLKSQPDLNGASPQGSPALTVPKKRGPARLRRDSSLTAALSSLESGARKLLPKTLPQSALIPQVQIFQPRLSGSVHPSQRRQSVDVSQMEAVKRRGRPPGSKIVNGKLVLDGQKPAAIIQVVVPTPRKDDRPEYPVFRCRWRHCKDELHNISTLRKHIAKLHKPAQDVIESYGYVCLWKRCSLLNMNEDGTGEPMAIPTEGEWLEHVNEEHIHPLGQKYGDGPSTEHIGKHTQYFETIVSKYFYRCPHSSADARIFSYIDPQAVASDRMAYLANENGQITTDLITAYDAPDALTLTDLHSKDEEHNKAADTAMKRFMKNRGHHKTDPRAAADETLRAMKVRKEKIGVGIDRGGCTLVNDERRQTFEHYPGISKIVDYDY